MTELLEAHISELMILVVSTLILVTLWILVPLLLRSRKHLIELQHVEHLKALEKGVPLPKRSEAILAAGRTATLVPMVSICAGATVTCFLGAYHTDNMFAISLATWSVVGVVSLAAITGGVALMGRLAQVSDEAEEEEEESEQSV
jgi:hypothetical protein